MELIPGICTQCGATLSADKNKEAMICPYCGTAFVVKTAIERFNSIYNITVKDSGTVIIQNGQHADFEINGGVLKKYYGEEVEASIPNSVISIGDEAFKGTRVKRINIPDSVKHIGKFAFEGTDIESIDIPDSVEEIDDGAFKRTRIKQINIPDSVKHIGEFAFEGTDIESIDIPDSVERIGQCAFMNLKKLTEIRLPSQVKIAINTFRECTNLKSIKNITRSTLTESVGKRTEISRVDFDGYNGYGGIFKGCPIKRIEIEGNIINTYNFAAFLNKIQDDEPYLLAIGVFFQVTPFGPQALDHLVYVRERSGRCMVCGGSMSGFLVKTCTNGHQDSSWQKFLIGKN